MRINKKDEIVNVLFTVFLLITQQMCLLYAILSSARSNQLYLLFLVVDVFLCVYIVLSLYDENNAGVKISIQWMVYMTTLSSKMGVFCFLLKGDSGYQSGYQQGHLQGHLQGLQGSLLFSYLSNDVLVYNLIYLTPFIYLLFSLRSRNILEHILNNKIVVENILSIDVNIINLFDLIDLIFMYSHLTNLYRMLDHVKTHSFQNVFIMLIVVLVDIALFGFYFPIYTNIDKASSYTQETVGVLKGDNPGERNRSRGKTTKRDGQKDKHAKAIRQKDKHAKVTRQKDKHGKMMRKKRPVRQSDSYGKHETGERKKGSLFYLTNGGSGSTAIGRSAAGRSSASGQSSAHSSLSRSSSRRDQSGSNSSVPSQRRTTIMSETNVPSGANASLFGKSNVRHMKTNTTSKFFHSENETNMGGGGQDESLLFGI